MGSRNKDEEFKDEDELEGEGDADEGDGEGPSPEELREKRYPLAPSHRISEGKIERLSVWRILATGKPLLITSQACPLKTTWAEIKRVAGGGTYTVKAQATNNQFLGSQTETFVGRAKAAEQIVWPDSLTVGGGILESEGPAETKPDEGAADVALDRRTRESREWEARMAREQRQWEEELAARRARDEASARRSQEEHELRMKALELEVTGRTVQKQADSQVEMERVKGETEIKKAQIELDRKDHSRKDTIDRVGSFVERLGEKLLEKHPEKLAQIASSITGSRLDENAKAAVKEQFSSLREDLAGDLAEAALDETVKRADGPRLYEAMAKAILSDPDKSKEFLALLRDVAADGSGR